MVEIETIFAKVKAASEQADSALKGKRYATYLTYVDEYNKLLKQTKELFSDDEELKEFEPIKVEKSTNPIPGMDTKTAEYLSLATLSLSQRKEYLEGKLPLIFEAT